MADALLSALATTIVQNLNSLVIGQFAAAGSFRSELNNLQSTFTTIEAVLHDAEEKQWKNEAIKNWLIKLKDAAYEADDLLDEIAIHAQRPRNLKTKVRSFFSLENPIVFRVKMSHKLKSVREKLDVIASEKHKFHLREEVIGEDTQVGILDWRLTSSLVNESEIIGRDEEKEEFINMLLATSADLSVHAICGMGGLGKTTLAQLAYNDRRTERHFELRIWVCVSDDFSLMRLIRAIIGSIESSTPYEQELDPLQRRLQEKLSGRKFLLVLDDVWNEDRDKWDGLHNTIRSGAIGSAVIVTTRNENIALMMATTPVYHIGGLSDDDSWSLFERRAFGLERKEEEFIHLEPIGRDIVRKCGGVPLAIKAMGSLMSLTREESEWFSVKESEIWDLPNEGGMILPALRLSYTHLKPHLKQCFAFCSIFPKDYNMEKDRLICLWMANGFIPCKGQMNLYDMGQQIFRELVWRSFFQDVEEDLSGNATCKMHDLVHDLAQSIVAHECKFIQGKKKVLEDLQMVRHFSMDRSSCLSYQKGDNLFNGRSIRSFLWLDTTTTLWENESSSLFVKKHLRVLDMNMSFMEKFALSINRFKHLRYLDFSNSGIRSLPESTTGLQNLQTLNLRRCGSLYRLPKGMNKMKNLMFLDISGCKSLRYMPANMGQLTRLKRLSIFIVDKDNGHGIGELKEMNLVGELYIKKLDCVQSYTDSKHGNLMQKKGLKSLRLQWWGENDSNKSEEVLEGLQPHSNLRKLEIMGYEGSKFPNWIADLNLVEIHLFNCNKCGKLPPFGKLKFLKKLHLDGMNGVKSIGNEMYGNGEETRSFPSLESLNLNLMSVLEEWAVPILGGREVFPLLRDLNIKDCSKLVELPIIPSVKRLNISKGSKTVISSVKDFRCVTSLILDNEADYDDKLRHLDLTHLPDGVLQNHLLLERLEIRCMYGLRSLENELDNLSALKRLELWYCKELESLPEGLCSLNALETIEVHNCGIKSFPPINEFNGLSSLRMLSFQFCDEFALLSEGVRHLTALEDLMIEHCPKLNSLPEGTGHLTALRKLGINHCKGLSSLPNQMGNLTSLSKLEIGNCPSLMCLPDGIHNLKMLTHLKIIYCPTLEKRCEKDTGEDWPKIAHIPYIKLL